MEYNVAILYRRKQQLDVKGTDNLFAGCTSLSADDPMDEDGSTKVLLQECVKAETARALKGRLKGFNSPNIARYLFTDYLPRGKAILVLQSKHKSFQTWINRAGIEIWRCDDSGQVLGMGTDFIEFFQSFAWGLNSIYSKDQSHGNLTNGFRVGKDNQVVLYNLASADTDTMEQKDDRIRKDVRELREIVNSVLKVHPEPDGKGREEVKLFFTLCNWTKHQDGVLLRETAFFCFNNCLFYYGEDRRNLLYHLFDYRKLNEAWFSSMVSFEQENTRVRWPADSKEMQASQLDKVYTYGRMDHTFYNRGYATLFDFYYFTCAHLSDYREEKCTSVESEAVFSSVFPSVMPKLFFEVATRLAVDSAQKFQGTNLVNFLKERLYGWD